MSWILKQSKGCRFQLLFLVITRSVLILVNLIMAVMLSKFTDYALGRSKSSLLELVAITLMIFLIEGLIYIVESVSKKNIFIEIERKIRLDTIESIQKAEVLNVQKFHSAELLSRLTNDVDLVANCLPGLIINVYGGCMMGIAAMVYMFWVNWKLAMIILIAIPILGAATKIFSPIHQKWSKIDKENEDENRVRMQESLDHLIMTQIFHIENYMIEKVKKNYERKRKSSRSLGAIEGTFVFINNTTGSLMFLIIMAFGAYFTVRGEFSVGNMIAVLNLLNYVVWPFANISNSISEVNQAKVSAQRIIEVQKLDKRKENTQLVKQEKQEGFLLRNVYFAYDGNNQILNNLNLRWGKTGSIAVVGNSGSGKSTLLRLLLGIYHPNKGEVYFNFKSGKIAFVPSDNFIFTGTVRENICLSDEFDKERLEKAMRMANAYDFINQLPEKYDTGIGDGKQNLSSGQMQRIALARAYYTKAESIIFDEPTSNLDNLSIGIFHETICELSKKCLCIIATHDRKTLSICERIFLLENKAVNEIEKTAFE